MKPVRVLLVDDQALFREGLHALLSTDTSLEIVGEAANGQEAIRLVPVLKPQVVLMDLRMPVLGGVEATRQLRTLAPHTRVIVLTTFDDDEEVFEALRAGATGYLLKDVSHERIVEAIRSVARGESFLQPSIASKVVTEFARLSRRTPPPSDNRSSPPSSVHPTTRVEHLSERERQVLRQLALGRSNKEIAVALDLVEGTVKNHMSNILAKLGVLDRTQAALKARDLGLL